MQVAKEVVRQLQGLSGSITIFDRKRKQDLAHKLQQRWQRWEISNFDYIMQVSVLMQNNSSPPLCLALECTAQYGNVSVVYLPYFKVDGKGLEANGTGAISGVRLTAIYIDVLQALLCANHSLLFGSAPHRSANLTY